MSDLLQDDRFGDICSLECQNKGYVVVRKPRVISLANGLPAAGMNPRRVALCLDEPLNMDDAEVQFAAGEPALLVPSPLFAKKVTPMPQWTLSPRTLSRMGYAGIVRGPFMHAALPPPTPWQAAKRRTRSVPVDMGRVCIGSLSEQSHIMSTTDGSTTDNQGCDSIFSPPTSSENSSRAQSPLGLTVNRQVPARLSLATLRRSPLAKEYSEEPSGEDGAHAGISSLLADAAVGSMTPITPLDRKGGKLRRLTRRVTFCSEHSDLILEEPAIECAGIASEALGVQELPALTLGTLLINGMKVQNTFINVPPALPTPFKTSASTRSHSVPKNMGTDIREQRTPRCQQDLVDQTVQCATAAALRSPAQCIFPPTPWLSSPVRPSDTPGAFQASMKFGFPPTPW